jgi:DNA-binding PadR family transcriptional regulator
MGDVEAFAGVILVPGTLYTAITRLVEKKLITPQAGAGRQRPYELTAEGAIGLRESRADSFAGCPAGSHGARCRGRILGWFTPQELFDFMAGEYRPVVTPRSLEGRRWYELHH